MEKIFDRIYIDANICGGKPMIRGKRITVQTIMEFLAAGETSEEILKQYPSLEAEDLTACMLYAKDLMNHNLVIMQEVV